MTIGKPYIRAKGNKFIIEIKADAKTIFLKTLPSPEELLELITLQASSEYIEKKIAEARKASPKDKRLDSVLKVETKVPENFGYELLSEQSNSEEKRR